MQLQTKLPQTTHLYAFRWPLSPKPCGAGVADAIAKDIGRTSVVWNSSMIGVLSETAAQVGSSQ